MCIRDRLKETDEDTDRKMYYLAKEMLSDKGYKQYEISNFAKEGFECYHNKVYWRTEEYQGFGLGAHSYSGGVRFHNTYDMKEYLRGDEYKRQAMMFAEGEAYKNPVSIVYGEGNDIDYIYADERNAEGYEGVNSIHFEAEYSGAIAGDIREVSVSEGVDVPETFKYAASVNGAYFTTINGAIEAANDGDTVKCAPGTYDENIVFGDKSITLEGAQAGVKPDGENRTDDFRETILTGTISTANGGTTADAFNADQKIVVDGFKFEGDGLKVGDCSYSTVGSLTVKNCIMTFGDNAEDTIEGYGNNTYNYFVKISSVSPEASVTVEDNYVTGNPPAINDTAYVYPLQLWGVKEVSVINNNIILGE